MACRTDFASTMAVQLMAVQLKAKGFHVLPPVFEEVAAYEAIIRYRPAVVTLDADLPGLKPIGLLERLTGKIEPTRVMVYAQTPKSDFVNKSFLIVMQLLSNNNCITIKHLICSYASDRTIQKFSSLTPQRYEAFTQGSRYIDCC